MFVEPREEHRLVVRSIETSSKRIDRYHALIDICPPTVSEGAEVFYLATIVLLDRVSFVWNTSPLSECCRDAPFLHLLDAKGEFCKGVDPSFHVSFLEYAFECVQYKGIFEPNGASVAVGHA